MEHDFFLNVDIKMKKVLPLSLGAPIHHLLRSYSSLLSRGAFITIARGRQKRACAPGATLGGAEMTFEKKKDTKKKSYSFCLIFDQKWN